MTYEPNPPLYQVWTHDPAFFHLLGVALHWFATERREVAEGTLYVIDRNVPVWGFISDDLLIAGYESGPLADLLPEAERMIGKLRTAVRSISHRDELRLRFVAKKAAGSWRLMRYRKGDWEWILTWLLKDTGREEVPRCHVF